MAVELPIKLISTVINPLDFSGKTILLIGASSGIGRTTSILLSRLGARVILVARNRERLESAQKELTGNGHMIDVFDVNNYEGIPGWILKLSRLHGAFDGVFNCAGRYLVSPLRVLEEEQTEALWRVNVFSNLWLAKGFRQRGVNNAGGSLVLVSSAGGLVGQPVISAYSASKGAIISLTRSLAMELAREKIRVNCLAPGITKTNMAPESGPNLSNENLAAIEKEHPLGFGEPIDVAHAAVYLLSPAAKWITGTTLVVDGGYTAH